MIIVQFSRVEICGVDTSKIKVLKEAEKIELLKKIRENDDKKAKPSQKTLQLGLINNRVKLNHLRLLKHKKLKMIFLMQHHNGLKFQD